MAGLYKLSDDSMPSIAIESLADPRLDVYRDLPKSNLTALSGKFIVESRLLVERLAASDYAIESIAVDERQITMIPPNMPASVPVYVLPANWIEQLIGFNFHRGILACGRRKPTMSVEDLTNRSSGAQTYVACVDVQDPTNLGGILRNCAAFGVDTVILTRQCADPFSRRVLRVSMGTVFTLTIIHASNPIHDLRMLRDHCALELVASVLDADAEVLASAKRKSRVAILIGNEAHGLPLDIVEICQRRVTIPMDHGTDSLNAAAATAVLLYHFTRVARVV